MMDEQELERRLDKIQTAEQPLRKYGIQLLTLVFLAGGGWVTLDSVKAVAEENKEAIEAESQEADAVKEKLIRIEITQEHIKDDLEEAKELAEENSDKLDAILQELRKD